LWYLIGEDIGFKENRTFRLDRIQGDVTASKRSEMFTLPEQIGTFDYSQSALATLKVRKNRGFQLRNLASNSTESGEWDQIEIPIVNSSWLISSILWHLDDVEVVSPSELRSQVIANLMQMQALHV
jgi:proteasome accessory factor B